MARVADSPEAPAEFPDIGARFRLDDRVAVVTGASSGLGAAFALTLAQAGADVVIGARREGKLARTRAGIERLERRALAQRTDVTRPEECTALVEAGMERFGRVDVLINNAGVSDAIAALRQSPEDFRRVIEVNLEGAYWMAQACGRVMEPGSAVVNVSSILGLSRGEIPSAGYASSKAALVGLTRELAVQWATRKRIRVNALAPGFVRTELTSPLLAKGELAEAVLARTPMGRLAEPAEVCGAMLFLASDASSFVTGVTLPVDGGWLC
jgi:NAD(P)-dependent dehydrogenase (short-subunit alcohol dehydrogenase family)